MFFDTHCHIHMPQFDNDRTEVIERLKAAQVSRAVIVATEEAEIKQVLTIAEAAEGLYGAFAVSPQDEELPDLTAEEIASRVNHPKMVAVGETGLDYHYCHEPLDWQRNRFATHIEAALWLPNLSSFIRAKRRMTPLTF